MAVTRATPPCSRLLRRRPAHFGGAVGPSRRRTGRRNGSDRRCRRRRKIALRARRRAGSQEPRGLASLCPYALKPAGPLFVRREGRPGLARIVQLGDGADARRARPARERDAACAAPFVRHPSARARQGSAHHPGSARPYLAVDDARSIPASTAPGFSPPTDTPTRAHDRRLVASASVMAVRLTFLRSITRRSTNKLHGLRRFCALLVRGPRGNPESRRSWSRTSSAQPARGSGRGSHSGATQGAAQRPD